MENCKKCGNPLEMFWCAECENSCETDTCELCGKWAKLDENYHKNCNKQNNDNNL